MQLRHQVLQIRHQLQIASGLLLCLVSLPCNMIGHESYGIGQAAIAAVKD